MSSVPVSQYEALRAEMRNLVEQAQKVHEIATQVISTTSSTTSIASSTTNHQIQKLSCSNVGAHTLSSSTNIVANYNITARMESTIMSTQPPREFNYDLDGVHSSEDEYVRASSAQMSVSSEPVAHVNRPNNLYHGTWPVERTTMWASEPMKPDGSARPSNTQQTNIDQASVLSFASSSGGAPLDRVLSSPDRLTRRSMQQLEAKVDMVYSLLAMLGGQEHADMGDTLLALSKSPESCLAMRQSGCIPLLVQLVQSDKDFDTRKKASEALHNLIFAQPDEKTRKREMRVLKLIEQTSGYVEALKTNTEFNISSSSSTSASESSEQSATPVDDRHPVPVIANLMKHSFDEGHRQAICQLGGIQVIASLVEVEHNVHGSANEAPPCVLMRRYACMALTNLTFGDSGNKALLCSYREFMRALVVQLQSPSDELRQVTASVLRNLSWRADSSSKEILREVGTVTGLMKAGMATTKENTLKSILSALWNLSAHCTENKLEICAVEKGLGFLVDMLSYKAPSSSLTINENAGGILRNISSQIAVRDDYREILRKHNCLQMLLEQLKSPSLTIVSNACGTLWNLSAKNQIDQEALWQMGAPAMLRSLNHSKHKMIATGSSAALKNLLNSRPSHSLLPQIDSTARAMDLPALPTLGARKQKALMRDLDQNLAETYENIDRDSPTKQQREALHPKQLNVRNAKSVSQCHNHETQYSTMNNSHSEMSFDKDLLNGFNSLNLNEPSTSNYKSYSNNNSLSYMSNRYDKFPDDNDHEQPIDYSRKYTETPKTFPMPIPAPTKEEKNKSYTIYAETDLDQPTDYSLRYAEDDSDSDCGKKEPEFVQDTVKTYCTEGTPYETPVNFSTATSMSDLRIDIDNDKTKDRQQQQHSKESKPPNLSHLDEKDHCSVEDIPDLTDVKPKAQSAFSSGMLSPEKPVNYCEEGTPGYFSRVSSFGSLTSIPSSAPTKPAKEADASAPPTPPLAKKSEEAASKAVKFEANVNYAEQTPLMFSRSSSLASLDSVEQHSIHDDRSSVVSDFSRLTSGIVSPSELPDSPTQTVPPSPRPRKVLDYPSTSRGAGRPQPAPRSLVQKASVFEDNVTKFKEESTPAQFSTATSISSLTIDDQDEPICGDLQHKAKPPKASSLRAVEDDVEKQDIQEKPDSSSEFNEQLSENDEDDDILADCINIGMQNNRHRQTKPMQSSSKIPSLAMKSLAGRPQGSGIPIPRSVIPSPTLRSNASGSNTNIKPSLPAPAAHADSLRTYCTEDTPALLSHAGSNSDLSVLSMQTDNKSRKDYLSDDSSNLSGDNDNILAECIQSGMPKAKTPLCTTVKPPGMRNLPTSTPIKPFGNDVERKRVGAFLGARDELSNFAVENSPGQFSLRSSLSDLTVDGSIAGGVRTLGEGETDPNSPTGATGSGRRSTSSAGPSNNVHNTTGTSCNTNELSRQESLSSLSVESFGSGENEQALLEQCISSGMPKSNKQPPRPNQERPIGVATKQFSKQIARPLVEHVKEKENECGAAKPTATMSLSKNVSAASAAGSISRHPQAAGGDAGTLSLGADASRNSSSQPPHSVDAITSGPPPPAAAPSCHDTSPARSSPTDENLLTALTRSGCDKADKSLGKILDASISTSSYSNSDNCANLDRSEAGATSAASGGLVDSRMLDPDAMIESLDRFTAELVSQATLNKEENKFTASVHDGDTWNEDVTFPTITESAPHVMTFTDKLAALPASSRNNLDVVDAPVSGDFSSLNTATLTDSTLIAMEATKMAATFQKEAEMSQSSTSVTSLELDQIQPPSQMDSMSSAIESPKCSPRLSRKKSLPAGLMVRRALSNSLNQASSLESLIGNNSLTNLEQINPPSIMAEIDMDGSLISVDSIASDNGDDLAHPERANPIFNVKQPANMLHLLSMTQTNSFSDIEHVNPPSLYNEATDLCSSLADVSTDLGTTDVFEDCTTYMQTENDVTEFSDAHSITPIQSDVSSAENTPKKTRALTPRERRNMSKERYLTYTVDADKIMTREDDSLNDDFHTVVADVPSTTTSVAESYKTVAETYSTATFTRSPSRLTPKERRQQDQARFQTQVLSKEVLQDVTLATSNGDAPKSRIGIPKRRREENRDRFKTQTITSTPTTTPAKPANVDVMQLLEQEAKIVLKSLSETRSDELFDETLSLVSNDDDDSEPNSRCSLTYRTYRKSSSTSSANIPVISPPGSACGVHDDDDVGTEAKPAGKPKIVKPDNKPPTQVAEPPVDKAIRGRRKPLYSRPFKPPTVRATTPPKQPTKMAAKPPAQPKLQKAKTAPMPALQREGTFTKEDKKASTKIPISSAIPKAASTSRIAKPTSATSARSKLPSYGGSIGGGRGALVKSASSDRANRPPPTRVYNRSPSADSRIAAPSAMRSKPLAPSSPKNGAVKKSPPAKTSDASGASGALNGQTGKQIRSRIASLLKQVEETKKQQQKKDTRVWIQTSASNKLDTTATTAKAATNGECDLSF